MSQKDRDSFDCELAATQSVPQNTQIGYLPGYGGTQAYTFDRNSGLRTEFSDRCLVSKGYILTVVPVCRPGAVPSNLSEVLLGSLRAPKPDACATQVTSRSSNIVYAEELI
jgi:hypothetical protein